MKQGEKSRMPGKKFVPLTDDELAQVVGGGKITQLCTLIQCPSCGEIQGYTSKTMWSGVDSTTQITCDACKETNPKSEWTLAEE